VQLVVSPVTVRGLPDRRRLSGKAARYVERLALVCTENLIPVDDVMESPKLAE
jgi:hypothetical protein